MQIQLGELVLTSDGKDAAAVDRVILDATGHKVNAVVLRKGTIFPHDVEVQLDQLIRDENGHHRLVFSASQLEHLPRFDESAYTAPPLDLTLPYDYDREMVLWPGGGVGPIEPMTPRPIEGDVATRDEMLGRIYEQDAENAVIASGSAIISSDDHKVGEVERLSFEAGTGRLSSVLVRRGLLFATELELPGSLVDSAADGSIHLNVDKAKVEELTREQTSATP
jgi:uncharacterized protein YrrD